MGAIIDMQLFKQLKELERRYRLVCERAQNAGNDLSDTEIAKLVNEAVKFVRKSK
jgi:hypothetical protein